MNTNIFYRDSGYCLSLTHKTDISLKLPAGKTHVKPTAGGFGAVPLNDLRCNSCKYHVCFTTK